jgi:hypothetical protein
MELAGVNGSLRVLAHPSNNDGDRADRHPEKHPNEDGTGGSKLTASLHGPDDAVRDIYNHHDELHNDACEHDAMRRAHREHQRQATPN